MDFIKIWCRNHSSDVWIRRDTIISFGDWFIEYLRGTDIVRIETMETESDIAEKLGLKSD